MEMKKETWKCCICKRRFTGWGNNAQPVKDGKCCDECNWMYVIPARIAELSGGNDEQREDS